MFVVLVSGPPGVGKSTAIDWLTDAMTLDGIRHAVLEVDPLERMHPFPSPDESFRKIRALVGLLREDGHDLLILGATAVSAAYLAGLLEAIDAERTFVVRLDAAPETVQRRLLERERESWSGRDALVAAAAELAASMRAVPADLVLSTEHESAELVANRIRDALPDRLRRGRV